MELLSKYFLDLTARQKVQFVTFHDLFLDWNQKVNMVSRKDTDFLWERHILHSLSIAKLIHFAPGSDILDVGTGGGFPGIPLAILRPDIQFHLVDSIGKKIMVVNEVIKELDLANVTAAQHRAEKVKETFDFVITRAVAQSSKLVSWTQSKVKKDSRHDLPNGILALKGGDLKEELNAITRRWRLFDISSLYDEPFFETKKILHIDLSR